MAIYEDIFERPSVGGRYRVLKRLGSGAFGEVFLADQEVAGVPGIKFRQVALKLFSQDYVTLENAHQVFAEALLLEQLAARSRANGESIHLVTIYDLGILRDYAAVPFVAMECVFGSLEKQLAAAPSLPLATVLRHLRGICAGLKLAHDHTPAVVHRDLKPGNVLIEQSGFLKLADFGVAIDRHRAFLAGGSVGTISYAPPEGRGKGLHTPAFDIYSLGIMMLEMLSHHNPLGDALAGVGADEAKMEAALDSAQECLAALRDPKDGTSFTAHLHELRQSPAAQEVLRRCLALNPSERFANATELDLALADIEADRRGAAPTRSEETGRERVSRLLDEAAALLRVGNLAEAELRLAEVKALAPREERHFLLLSEIRERQQRWREAIEAQREGNRIVGERRPNHCADPVMIERLALLYERSGKPLAAKETRRLLGIRDEYPQ